MQTITIRKPEDVDALVRQVMGHAPADSLCIIPLGSVPAPHARVDFAPVDMLREGFATALPHWDRVLVVTFGETSLTEDDMRSILPGVDVVAVIARPNPPEDAFGERDLRQLAGMAATATEATEAAWAAYLVGDGALAWRYLDRAEALDGTLSARGLALSALLSQAVSPHQAR